MSIVEVLVAGALFTVLTTMIASVAILGLRTTTGMEVRLDNSTQGDVGMAASGKVLRTAVLPDQLDSLACDGCADTAIVQATSTRVTFYANLDNTGQGPSLTTLEVLQDPLASGTAILRQTTIPPTPTSGGHYRFCNPATEPACVVSVRTLARGLVWPTAAVFTYYDFDGARIAGTSLPAADLPRVSSADISITVQSQPGAGYPTTTVVQRVRLPNADINVLVEAS
ncbi:hypothetical protein [Nocardioides caricicola]|uniref:Type II secretion system protein n=1 Tax=Nocardioides caricicola TaxID=634770 RepID=A0ABW0N836_9ACTN